MENAVRRLQQVQSAVSDRRRVLVLPSGENVYVYGPVENGNSTRPGSTTISIEGSPILDFRALDSAFDTKLILSAVGTPFENSEQEPTPKYPVLELALPDGTSRSKNSEPIENEDVWAVVYTLWTVFPSQDVIPIYLAASIPEFMSSALKEYLLRPGLARRSLRSDNTAPKDILYLLRGAFWQGGGTGAAFFKTNNDNTPDRTKASTSNSNPSLQRARSWLQYAPERDAQFPSSPSFTRNATVIASHPLRPPKPPRGTCMYARFCAPPRGPGKTLTMHVFDPGAGSDSAVGDASPSADSGGGVGVEDSEDMKAFHRWMNDPRVGRGWGEQGSIEQHREYVRKIERDPHVLALVMCWDGERMGYLELTWIKEDHVATFVPDGAHDYDRGLHVLVGEDKFRGQMYSQAWFRSVTHYIFLSDPRTMRIIGEPKRSNPAIIRTSEDAGMHLQTFFYFPYKYSAMTMNLRERFFKEDMLL